MYLCCSDGVWDPEKWHASLYPSSERSSPVEGFKKDYGDDRVPLKRRIPGNFLMLALKTKMTYIKSSF